jgi:hypothetical protein
MGLYEQIIGDALLGGTPQALTYARVVVQTVATTQLTCRTCGVILDSRSMAVLTTRDPESIEPGGVHIGVCHECKAKLKKGAAQDIHVTYYWVTWEGTETYPAPAETERTNT